MHCMAMSALSDAPAAASRHCVGSAAAVVSDPFAVKVAFADPGVNGHWRLPKFGAAT